MAFITLSGTLRDPTSELAVGDQIRFTHKSTTGETVEGAVSVLTIDPSGTYSKDLQYGLVLVEYKDVRTSQFKNLGVATVNGSNPATSIPELLNALVPVSSAELIEFQAILADAITARNEAEAFANSIDLINDLSQAYIFDTVAEYKASTIVFPVGKTIHLKDRGADFTVIAGNTVTLDHNIIYSTGISQSISLVTNEIANVVHFGAKGDGVTDDQPAMQAAINTNLPVYIPRHKNGGYLIRDSLTTTGTGIAEIKADKAIILNEVPLGNIAALIIQGSLGGFPDGRNGTFKGFKIDDVLATHAVGIYLKSGTSWNYFEDVECWNCASGVEFSEFNIANVFHKCTFKANRWRAVLDPAHTLNVEQSVANVFSACNIEQSPICLDLNSNEVFITNGCVIEAYTEVGIKSSRLVSVTNSYIESVDDNTIGIQLLSTARNCIVTGNTILQNAAANSVGISYTGGEHYICGNMFGGSAAGSFDIQNPTNTPSGCTIIGNGRSNGMDIGAGDTTVAFMDGENAQFGQILLTALGQFGGGVTNMIGSFDPSTNIDQDFGSTTKKWKDMWAKRMVFDSAAILPSDAAGQGNNQLFLDSADNILKWKDNLGVLKPLY